MPPINIPQVCFQRLSVGVEVEINQINPPALYNLENEKFFANVQHYTLCLLFLGNNGNNILLSNRTIGDILVIREKYENPVATERILRRWKQFIF